VSPRSRGSSAPSNSLQEVGGEGESLGRAKGFKRHLETLQVGNQVVKEKGREHVKDWPERKNDMLMFQSVERAI
jgi:hypothetical protein